MLIETERLIITEFTMDMAQIVQENSMDEDNKRFVPDEVWESVEEVEETLEFLISQYGSFEGPLVYPIIVKENNDKSYIARLLNNQKIDQQLKRLISSSVRMDGLLNISYEEYTGIDLYLPSLLEQQKIADFLFLVDRRIEKQRQLVESLKKYKRGLFLKLYNDSEKKG